MQKAIYIIIILLTMQKCSKPNNVIDSVGINTILIRVNDKGQKAEESQTRIKNKHTINTILKKLNSNKREPIKFYPTHKLKIIYDDGHENEVFCSGTLMKYQGHTYKLEDSIYNITKQ